ncbi:peptidoglycan/LPS O-acetylase OafA/YrhL [Rhodopseudomonas rhenobacensis]|uniref:Peptidoglycan/LPS O-acetylase OafA/YrhL n=1 Tax=Rhodopseudomonas rhenobacensis TaxID=87461 RepID=A0A7W7Z294_9BRAD|nr:acyltransferase [Rhodopseudomonas rhenobacensis]MBB5046543.1 peptidoglycan/LPS O-acetylase OafA/YrhL [Rhodopseudomonas rhenobacensis]
MKQRILADCLGGRNNNFDILRLTFSLFVLVGHSFVLDPPSYPVPFHSILKSTWLGSLGVLGFFAISGFLVADSAARHTTIGFTAARVLRIFPALIVSLLLTILLMMNYSSLPARAFLTHPETVWYFVCNVIFYKQTVTLPGIVDGIPNVMNGALWTLNSEVRAYFLLGLVAAFNVMSNKVLATTSVVLVMLVGYFNFGDLPTQLNLPLWKSVSIYFAVGVLFWIYRSSIILDWKVAALCGAWFIWFQGAPYFDVIAPIPWCYFVLCLAYLTPPLPLAQRIGDLSYGLYIYAWPIQLLVSYHVKGIGPWTHVFITLAIAASIAWLSWTLIEKPSLALKRYFMRPLDWQAAGLFFVRSLAGLLRRVFPSASSKVVNPPNAAAGREAVEDPADPTYSDGFSGVPVSKSRAHG